MIATREGASFDEPRARAVVHVMAALFDLAMATYVDTPDRDFLDLFAETVRSARSAFA
jgi:hypothetical protein